jgi:hypothetical protein
MITQLRCKPVTLRNVTLEICRSLQCTIVYLAKIHLAIENEIRNNFRLTALCHQPPNHRTVRVQWSHTFVATGGHEPGDVDARRRDADESRHGESASADNAPRASAAPQTGAAAVTVGSISSKWVRGKNCCSTDWKYKAITYQSLALVPQNRPRPYLHVPCDGFVAASDAAITPGCQKVSFAVEFIKNQDIITHHLRILLILCSESSTWFARLLWWQFFCYSPWLSLLHLRSQMRRRVCNSHLKRLLSSQRVPRKRDGWRTW